VLAYHVREGHYGDVRLDGLNVLALATFEGNIWAGAKATMALFFDERADDRQLQALQMISVGKPAAGPGSLPTASPRSGAWSPLRYTWR
jgi:hypothetical protein